MSLGVDWEKCLPYSPSLSFLTSHSLIKSLELSFQLCPFQHNRSYQGHQWLNLTKLPKVISSSYCISLFSVTTTRKKTQNIRASPCFWDTKLCAFTCLLIVRSWLLLGHLSLSFSFWPLKEGLPQDSSLGLQVSCLHTRSWEDLKKSHGFKCHLYPGYFQTYILSPVHFPEHKIHSNAHLNPTGFSHFTHTNTHEWNFMPCHTPLHTQLSTFRCFSLSKRHHHPTSWLDLKLASILTFSVFPSYLKFNPKTISTLHFLLFSLLSPQVLQLFLNWVIAIAF